MRHYRLTERASGQFDAIIEYVARDSTEVALRLLDDFVEPFRRLAEHPGAGHSRPDLTDKPFLFYRVHRFLIVYHVEVERAVIARI